MPTDPAPPARELAPRGPRGLAWIVDLLGAVVPGVPALVAGFLGGRCVLDHPWPRWDERNRTWHEMVLGTSMVRT